MDPAPAPYVSQYVSRIHGHLDHTVLSAFPAPGRQQQNLVHNTHETIMDASDQ